MEKKPPKIPPEEPLVVDNWPMSPETTRAELAKAKKQVQRYQAALRLASVEIERRNKNIIELISFLYQAAQVTDPSALLRTALVQALQTIEAPIGAVVIIDKQTKELTIGVHKGLTKELQDILTGRQLGVGAVTLMPHLVAGTGALLEYQTAEDQQERYLLAAGNLTSLVSLPLQIGAHLIGALLVGLQDQKTFNSSKLCFLMALAQETAVALETLQLREGLWHTAEWLFGDRLLDEDDYLQELNDADLKLEVTTPIELPIVSSGNTIASTNDLEQLLAAMMEAEEEVQQQNTDLQTLITIAELMNRTLNLNEIVQCAVEQTQMILQTDAAWLYLVDEVNQLEMRAHAGLSNTYVRAMYRLKLDDAFEGDVVLQHKAILVEAVSQRERPHKIWVDKEGLQALAAVPIARPDAAEQAGKSSSYVIGVLAIGKKGVESYMWTPREMRLLNSIANQVALAIDNARLHAQVKDDHTGLSIGNEILHSVNDMLLERNVGMESYIDQNLLPGFEIAGRLLQRFSDEESLTSVQKQDVVTLQRILARLHRLAQKAKTGNLKPNEPEA